MVCAEENLHCLETQTSILRVIYCGIQPFLFYESPFPQISSTPAHSAVMWQKVLVFIACYSLVLVSSQTTSPVPSLQTPIPPEKDVLRCEPITIDICMDLGYDNASFPNFRLQETQAEATTELRNFWPLIRAQCSNAIVHMLCAVYAPSCSLQFPNVRLRPCRNLCMHVRNGCEARLQSFGFAWPPHLDCNQYSNDPLCFGPPDPSEVEIPQSVLNVTHETPGTPVGAWYICLSVVSVNFLALVQEIQCSGTYPL